MKGSSSVLLGIAAGIAVGLACGLMMFDRRIYGSVRKKLSSASRSLERQRIEWRDAAENMVDDREQDIKRVHTAGKRVIDDLAS